MKYPYSTTVSGLMATLNQLRSAFPAKVNADTLKKWGIAANNESSILNTVRFVGLIDEEDNRSSIAARVFVIHDNTEFAREFGEVVKAAYKDLFELNGDPQAWTLDRGKLINFFRTSDGTSARVGDAQASTFSTLATLAGHQGTATAAGATAQSKPRAPRKAATPQNKVKSVAQPSASTGAEGSVVQPPMALRFDASPFTVSVRIELNLPISDKQEVYDNIFRSIRENLINA